MSITFAVDDVAPAPEAPLTCSRAELAPNALFVGGDPSARVVDHQGVHPLFMAVHTAFAEHRPLVLSPDAIWLTVAQGFAQHIRLNAAQLRPRLVGHAGRKTLTVVRVGRPPESTAEVASMLEAFRSELAEEVGQGILGLLTCDFSTTTEVDYLASQVVLLDAFSPYFDLSFACICGIPEVTLLGTPADYRSILDRVPIIAEFGLDLWAKSLERIGRELVDTAEGRPNRAFWQKMYKPKEAYGWERATGWIARLYPYLRAWQRIDQQNPLLKERFSFEPAPSDRHFYNGPGVTTQDVPASLARIQVDVRDQTVDPPTRFGMTIEGGLTHIEVDASGRLKPCAGLHVLRRARSIIEVIERLRRDHITSLAESASPQTTLPAEVVALYDHIATATLFEGPDAWCLRPLRVDGNDHEAEGTIWVPGPPWEAEGRCVDLFPLLDLPGERLLCVAAGVYVCLPSSAVRVRAAGKGVHEVTGLECEMPEVNYADLSLDEVPVVSRSLAELLTSVLDQGPLLQLTPLGTLASALDS